MASSESEEVIEWRRTLSELIGMRVAKFRNARGWSAHELSEQLRMQLGIDMKRTVLSDLETGTRRSISVAEVIALAYVLGVPPVLLIVPLGESGEDYREVEVVPGIRVSPWNATYWLTGDGPLGQEDEALVEVADAHADDCLTTVWFYKMHHELRYEAVWDRRAYVYAEKRLGEFEEREVDRLQSHAEKSVSLLRLHRDDMHKAGLPLPSVPADLDGLLRLPPKTRRTTRSRPRPRPPERSTLETAQQEEAPDGKSED